jgi:protein-L-isoaspartate(D-aspartate) O-methyltransferase
MSLSHRMLTIALVEIITISTIACSSPPPQNSVDNREKMIRQQLIQRGITQERILNAFRKVPRELFVLPQYKQQANRDIEIPFGFHETIDRPYEDALLLQYLNLKKTDRVLEIGTGSGYFTSLLAYIAQNIFTIEIVDNISQFAQKRFQEQNLLNIQSKIGDGFLGWPENAPFDAIILRCSPKEVPEPLIKQLAEGGRLLLPQGGNNHYQELLLYEKQQGTFQLLYRIAPTHFDSMKGKAEE